jgi:hypothetical protein
VALFNVFQRVTDEEPPGAVTLFVYELNGRPVADVSWPEYSNGGAIIGPAIGNPTPMPEAINQAVSAMVEHGLNAVVISIKDRSMWNDEWGVLQD